MAETGVDSALSAYEMMIDSITDYEIVRLDPEGIILTWPSGARQLTGYSAEEAIGRPLTILYPSDEVPAERLLSELRVAAEKGRHKIESWQARRDGARFWASAVLTPIHADDRSVSGYVLVARDVSEARSQEIAMRSMEQMLDAITDYEVIRLDAQGLVQSWNPGARALKQYTAEEVLGHHVSMFYVEEDIRSGLAEREMAAATRAGRYETEGWRVRKDGSRLWSSISMSPIRDDAGEVTGYVKVARDLTDRREQEQLVQRQRDEILELSTPVIQVWDKVLVLPIIGTLDSARAARLTESLLERIATDQAEVAILDISGVPAIDTDVAQHLLKTVEAARLMGTTSILSGVRPETAQAIVHLGIELGRLRSRNTLQDALQLALRLVGAGGSDERSSAHA
jgi:rsbT co-antagonist protein RsbR